ncbi:MAG: hypothetical protein RLZZ502_481 [Pseudomonadota bacterium]|jgi:predicted O-methyltransferase YrrM
MSLSTVFAYNASLFPVALLPHMPPLFIFVFFLALSCLFLLWYIKRKFKHLIDMFERESLQTRQDSQQLEHLIALYKDLDLPGSLPPTRGWAGSPDFLRAVYEQVRTLKPDRVVECGSGVSTIVITRALEQNGKGHLWSLDHDAHFAALTAQRVEGFGLSHRVSMLIAPLHEVGIKGQSSPWYQHQALPEGTLDLVVIDGPPITEDPRARFAGGPALISRLSAGGAMLLDDANRPGERAIADEWRALYPHLKFEHIGTEKGMLKAVHAV